jgi:hypothetical protein
MEVRPKGCRASPGSLDGSVTVETGLTAHGKASLTAYNHTGSSRSWAGSYRLEAGLVR